jgi:hypothetical protein
MCSEVFVVTSFHVFDDIKVLLYVYKTKIEANISKIIPKYNRDNNINNNV